MRASGTAGSGWVRGREVRRTDGGFGGIFSAMGGGGGGCSEEVDELVVVVEEDFPVPEGAVAAVLLEVAEEVTVLVAADELLSDFP